MSAPIYLDFNATTPVDPRAVEAMVPYLHEHFGNASSAHRYGYDAMRALDTARMSVARVLGCRTDEVVFTGGGSEANNLAIKGTVFAGLRGSPHVVTTAIEHPSVLTTLQYLQQRCDIEVTLVPVNQWGEVSPSAVESALRSNTILVTIMHANNEVGTIQPISEIASITRRRGILLHVDAAQSVGKVPVDVDHMGVDMLTLAGHKLYAPKGIGALYVRRGVKLDALVHGSQQEYGLRAGTENVASAVALGTACDLVDELHGREETRLLALREQLHQALRRQVPELVLNGHPTRRLPNTLNVSFPDALGSEILMSTPGVAASTGAACHAGRSDPSSVLTAMNLPKDRALGAVRLSVGRWTTAQDVDKAARLLSAGYATAVASTSHH